MSAQQLDGDPVEMQLMRPAQLEAALRRLPVVYVPLGLIEWHGQHLPLGVDALKAHGVLVQAARMGGGVVYPPIYFPYATHVRDSDALHPDEPDWKVAMLTALFERLKATGARVVIAVSGHNVKQQIAWVNAALAPVIADGQMAGEGLWEVSLSQDLVSANPESGTDHAAKWETSDIMHLHPELVDLASLGDGELAPNMKPPDGIGGLDPRIHASAEAGRRNIELAAESIANRARELLATLPDDRRDFALPGLTCDQWWLV